MSNTSIYGYIRRLDLDGQIRVRQRDDLFSPIVFEGLFQLELLPPLREAFYEMIPVTLEIHGETVVHVKLEKPAVDFGYEIT